MIAAGKLQEILPQRPITYKGQNIVSLSVLAAAAGLGIALMFHPSFTVLFPIMVAISLLFGVLLVTPIGGADMPTVISLLNAYAGLADALLGFVLNSRVLIVAGALDGASGLILSIIMCKAMNRSFANVLFGAFGQVQTGKAGAKEQRTVRSATPGTSPTSSRPPTTSSSCPATAWPWPRHSTRFARCTTCSPPAALTSPSASTPSPAACPDT